MAFTRDQIVHLYRRRARRYDTTAGLYYLMGFRIQAYRRLAVAALGLQTGDVVVEVGCGTGLNFPLLQQAVGPEGKIIGVDFTDAMLAQARTRVDRARWRNVELVACDASRYEFPNGLSGILSTFALTLVPEYDAVIRKGAQALAPGRRWVVADLRKPTWPGSGLAALLLVPFYRPFAVTLDLAERRPWESMTRYLKNVTMSTQFLGFAYVATGEA